MLLFSSQFFSLSVSIVFSTPEILLIRARTSSNRIKHKNQSSWENENNKTMPATYFSYLDKWHHQKKRAPLLFILVDQQNKILLHIWFEKELAGAPDFNLILQVRAHGRTGPRSAHALQGPASGVAALRGDGWLVLKGPGEIWCSWPWVVVLGPSLGATTVLLLGTSENRCTSSWISWVSVYAWCTVGSSSLMSEFFTITRVESHVQVAMRLPLPLPVSTGQSAHFPINVG